MQITQTPSPNFNARKLPISMLVLHYTGMQTGQAALTRMCDPAAEVSAHYMVWEDGRIVQLVDETKRAWHAGVGSWQGETDLNSCSVGIEIVNGGHDWPRPDGTLPPYPPEQIAAVIALARAIIARHPIPAGRIVGHSDIAPSRKADPGEHFPWKTLAHEGLGLWPFEQSSETAATTEHPTLLPGDTGKHVRVLQDRLIAMGYGLDTTGTYDTSTEACVTAFKRHWLQEDISGHTDAQTWRKILAVQALFVE